MSLLLPQPLSNHLTARHRVTVHKHANKDINHKIRGKDYRYDVKQHHGQIVVLLRPRQFSGGVDASPHMDRPVILRGKDENGHDGSIHVVKIVIGIYPLPRIPVIVKPNAMTAVKDCRIRAPPHLAREQLHSQHAEHAENCKGNACGVEDGPHCREQRRNENAQSLGTSYDSKRAQGAKDAEDTEHLEDLNVDVLTLQRSRHDEVGQRRRDDQKVKPVPI
mmetsp:Transcript_24976/g.63358  ORF Transcript_24976/g.63358 Transcript_24976/m.63358 type:complete len:220 (-) Transcript_24976:3778-4437(-)